MYHMTMDEIVSAAVAAAGKPALYFLETDADDFDVGLFRTAMKYIADAVDVEHRAHVLYALIHGGLMFFDSVELRDRCFHIFNRAPLYASAYGVVSYDADGKVVDENT